MIVCAILGFVRKQLKKRITTIIYIYIYIHLKNNTKYVL